MTENSSSSAPAPGAATAGDAPKTVKDMPGWPINTSGFSDDTWGMIVVLEYLIEYINQSILPASKIKLHVHQLTRLFDAPRYRRRLRVSAVWDLLHNLAVALYNARLYRLASEVYDFVLSSVPGRGDSPRPGETSTWYSGGIIYMKAHRYEDAARLYVKLLKYADSEPRTQDLSRICLENIGHCYMKMKDYKEAAPIYVRFWNKYSMFYYDEKGRRRSSFPGARRNANRLMRLGYIVVQPCPGPYGRMSTEYAVACPEASGRVEKPLT